MLANEQTLADLQGTFYQAGELAWIGIRPARTQSMRNRDYAILLTNAGIEGDHRSRKRGSNRQVTLLQAEHLAVIASLLGRESIEPGLLRRNLIIRGINLAALHNQVFRVGNAILQGTGYCHPCSRMEETLGTGGYNAVRGHGGITACVIEGAKIRIGDTVRPLTVHHES